MTVSTPSLAKIAAEAARLFASAFAKTDGSAPLSPAKATTALAARPGYPTRAKLVGIVAEVFYRENALAFPLEGLRVSKKTGLPTEASLASAVAKRRRSSAFGGRLGRWDVLAYAVSAALGAPGEKYSIPAVRALAEAGGVDLALSYAGRGTRAGVPATRADDLVETAERLA